MYTQESMLRGVKPRTDTQKLGKLNQTAKCLRLGLCVQLFHDLLMLERVMIPWTNVFMVIRNIHVAAVVIRWI